MKNAEGNSKFFWKFRSSMFLIVVFVTMGNNLIIVPHISVILRLIKEELFTSFYT